MGLLDLKTDLKSLKYGNDQRGGGSSNQPYIVTPIPDGFADTSPDFILRNGYLNPINAAQDVSGFIPVNSVQDVSRLTKLFTDTKSPNGLLFIAKQEFLERQNVEIPGGLGRVYNPAGTLAQVGVLSGGYHLNKQGLNPFQRGYFNGGENGYYQNNIPKLNDGNGGEGSGRLTSLYYEQSTQANPKDTSTQNELNIKYNISVDNPINMISYSGGPGSVLGVGKTNIRFTGAGKRERTNNEIVIKDALDIFKRFNPNTTSPDLPQFTTVINTNANTITPAQGNGSTALLSLNNTYNPRISEKGGGKIGEFNRETTYKTSNTTYKIDRISGSNTSYNSDEINILKRFITGSGEVEIYKEQDLVKFYFEVINNDTTDDINNSFLFFRAYINNLGDNFKAEWQSYKYVGRGENFYKYGGFSRDISLSFTIYAHSRAEMIPIYEKLNYLVGVTAPSYSNIGLMRGNFIKMTVGDYLIDVPGIIQNINLKPSFEAGWDINRDDDGKLFDPNIEKDTDDINGTKFVGQLPRLIEVDLQFTPIHTFTPQIGQDFIRNI
jgi:hypothetical protein